MINLSGVKYIRIKPRNAKKYKTLVADNMPVVAAQGGLAVHMSTTSIESQGHDGAFNEYRVSHMESGAAIVPKHFDYKAEAIRLMKAACGLCVDWTLNFDSLIAATKGKGVAGDLDRLCREVQNDRP